MKVVGITGPSGAGKSICSDWCRLHAFVVIDADAVYHSVIVPPSACLDELRITFGNEVLNADGTLCRKALAAIVFSDETHYKQKQLNQITHKYVLDKIRHEIHEQESAGGACVFVDAPLLIECGFHRECDTVISVLADRSIRKERIMQRDGITAQEAQRRIDAQPTDEFYKAASNYVIFNNDSLKQATDEFCEILLKIGISL